MSNRVTVNNVSQFTIAIPVITWILVVWFLLKAPYRILRRTDDDVRTKRSAAIGGVAWCTLIVVFLYLGGLV